MRRTVLAGAVALAAAGSGAAVVAAQGTPPSVTLTASASAVTVTGAEALKSGPTRFQFKATGGERELALLELKPGVTDDAVTKAAPNIETAEQAREYGTLVTGGAATKAGSFVTTITIKAARYAVIDITRRPAVRALFTAGDPPNGTTVPAPAATLDMDDFRFRGPATLPKRGVIRFQNVGEQAHHAVAMRLTAKANARRIARTIRQGKEPKSGVAGFVSFLGIADPATVNDVEVNARAGRYLLLCFIEDERRARGREHARLGMIKQVRFR
jgi:hypothetical protein